MKRKTTSRKPTSKPHNAALARIWHAAQELASCDAEAAFTQTTKTGLAPFLEFAIELASASFAAPREDLTPLITRAQVALESAIQLMPVLKDCLEKTPLTAQATKTLQVGLVRDAVKIIRAFSGAPASLLPESPSHEDYEPYTPKRAADLEDPDPARLWMVEHLWQRSAAGIIGGGPKGCKTWLALDIALSVASATPALDTFQVHQPGGVLYVNAEGGEAYLKDRLSALCVHRKLDLNTLPHELHVIPGAIRIDTPAGLGRLEATIRAYSPTLVVLDPLVRLHRLDENSASSISGLLSTLTELQQSLGIALILVHHSKKQNSNSAEMTGRDIRGSGDLHAWGSSNILMRRKGNRVIVSAEHRAAPSGDKWTLRTTTDEHPRLEIVEGDDSDDAVDQDSEADNKRIEFDICNVLQREGPKSKTELRSLIKGSNDRVGKAVDRLAAEGKITQARGRWELAKTNGKAQHLGPS